MRNPDVPNPLAVLALRLALGVIMIAHGWPKVHNGMPQFVHLVRSLGMPGWLAYVAAWAEFAGGILVILGLLTRIAGLFILCDMLVAIGKVHLHNGLLGHPGKPGYDFPLSLAAIALSLIFLGPGPLSADWLFGKHGGEPH